MRKLAVSALALLTLGIAQSRAQNVNCYALGDVLRTAPQRGLTAIQFNQLSAVYQANCVPKHPIARIGPIGRPVEIARPVEIGRPVEVGRPVAIGTPVQVGRPVTIGRPVAVGSPVVVGAPGAIARPIAVGVPTQVGTPWSPSSPRNIGTATQIGHAVPLGHPVVIGTGTSIGSPAPTASTVPIGSPMSVARPMNVGTAIPIGNPTTGGNPHTTSRAVPVGASSQIGASGVVGASPQPSTNPYVRVLTKSTGGPPSTTVSTSQPSVKLSDLPLTGVYVAPNNINGGIQVQSDSKSQNPFIRDWTRPSSTASGDQASSVKLTAAQNEALLPSYQQAAAGQTPSCVIFVRAKLLQETNGKVNFPSVNTAADILTLARNNQLPGLTYTPLSSAVQSGQIKPGDMLVWQQGVANGSGHIAYVSAVNGSKVTVEQRDFSTPQARSQYASTSPERWLDTETINLSQPTQIAGVLSLQ